MTDPCTRRLKSGTPTPGPPTVESEHVPQPEEYNPYREIVENDGDARFPGRSAAWLRILDLLADGQGHTLDECVEAADGLWVKSVKGLLHWGLKTGRIATTVVPGAVEEAPDVWVVRYVHAYRVADEGIEQAGGQS